jgi:hypothetical protein
MRQIQSKAQVFHGTARSNAASEKEDLKSRVQRPAIEVPEIGGRLQPAPFDYEAQTANYFDSRAIRENQ